MEDILLTRICLGQKHARRRPFPFFSIAAALHMAFKKRKLSDFLTFPVFLVLLVQSQVKFPQRLHILDAIFGQWFLPQEQNVEQLTSLSCKRCELRAGLLSAPSVKQESQTNEPKYETPTRLNFQTKKAVFFQEITDRQEPNLHTRKPQCFRRRLPAKSVCLSIPVISTPCNTAPSLLQLLFQEGPAKGVFFCLVGLHT